MKVDHSNRNSAVEVRERVAIALGRLIAREWLRRQVRKGEKTLDAPEVTTRRGMAYNEAKSTG